MRILRPKPSSAVLLMVGSRRLRGPPVLVHEASRRVWGLRLRRTGQELALLSCLSWNWRKRSVVKITERTYEKRAHELHPRRERSHPEAPPLRKDPGFRSV